MGPYYLREILRDLTLQEVKDLVGQVRPLSDSHSSVSSEGSSSNKQISDEEMEDDLYVPATSDQQSGFHDEECATLHLGESCPTVDLPSSSNRSGLPVDLSHLETCEKNGLSSLISVLCSYSLSTDGECDSSNANQIVRWLTTFTSRQVARILFVLSLVLPALSEGLWDLLPPLGGFLLTDHLDHLEDADTTNDEANTKNQLIAQLYGRQTQKVLLTTSHKYMCFWFAFGNLGCWFCCCGHMSTPLFGAIMLSCELVF